MGAVMTVLGRWPLSVETTQGMALLLSGEHPLREGGCHSHIVEKAPQIFINDTESCGWEADSQPRVRSAWQRRKRQGCGAKHGAEAWLLLLLAGQRVSSYFTFLNLSPLTRKRGIILATP